MKLNWEVIGKVEVSAARVAFWARVWGTTPMLAAMRLAKSAEGCTARRLA